MLSRYRCIHPSPSLGRIPNTDDGRLPLHGRQALSVDGKQQQAGAAPGLRSTQFKVTSQLRQTESESARLPCSWVPPAYQPCLTQLLPLTSVPLARPASSPRRLSGHGISPSDGLVSSRLGDKALFPPSTVMRLHGTPHTASAPGMIAIEGVDSLGHTPIDILACKCCPKSRNHCFAAGTSDHYRAMSMPGSSMCI